MFEVERSRINMEVPYERQGGELETRMKKRSHPSHLTKKPLSPTISDSSSCLSSESSTDCNLEYFAKLGTTNSNSNSNTTYNGENGKVPEPEVITPVIQEGPGEKVETFAETQENNNVNFEEIIIAENEGTNGYSIHQNGSRVVHSLRESTGEDNEMDVGSHGSSFSKSPDTAVGLKYFESLFEESSSGLIPTHTINAENGIVSQNKIHRAEEVEPEVEEYDVERVMQKQETHDLYCPNCRSCITKKVILCKRKRKIQEISTAEEASESGLDQSSFPEASDSMAEESQQPPQLSGAPDSRLDAISCFSCFSICVPSGEGFLCWRFKPKADSTRQPDGTSTDVGQVDDSETDSTGTIFPLWVVTCCQPTEGKKSGKTTATLGSIYPPISEDDIMDSPRRIEPPLQPSDDVQVSSTPGTLVPEHSTGRPHIEGPQHGAGTTLQNKPLNSSEPYGDVPSSETPSNITTDEGINFPLWVLTCCQPSMVEKKMDHPVKLDGTAPPQEIPSETFGEKKPDHPVKQPDHPVKLDGTTLPREFPSAASGGTESDHLAKPDGTVPQRETLSEPSGGTITPLAPSDDNPISSSKPESPAIFVPAVLPMPSKPQPPVIPSDTHEAESLVDVEPGLAREPPRPGVAGFDIIKAIVYGGLLESITSLSVITSAGGGDATTLNIVALGLANVFGGLIVLIHNLRVLKHEHTTEHYKAQLGRPGHYMLHAIVAIISYLVFGLMSPIIYGFSFRKSDNKDYKLAALAAAALVWITLLSAAKAHVRNPPKGYIKTVLYYICLGFMVSGLGYVAGDVINMVLKKFGVFDSRAPDDVPVLAAGVINGIGGAWLSY